MAEAGFLDPKPFRPGAAATVILLHGAAIAALLLIKNPEVARRVFKGTDVVSIPLDPPPPPPPTPQPDEPLTQQTKLTTAPVPTPLPTPFRQLPAPPAPPPDTGALSGSRTNDGVPDLPPRNVIEVPPPPPPPVREVVRTQAELVSGDRQPPYPSSEQRLEREGRVVIRLTIGTDGRVKAAEKVNATSDAFYTATERHARARWRFRPATVDGRPVETTKTLTVVFRLDAA